MNEHEDRLLRASIPEPFKNATSAIGGAQGYIATLEHQRDHLRKALEEIEAMVGKPLSRPGEVLSIAAEALKATKDDQ